jgi:cellulose synthase/poly-beta-1,6-N-acetylglucosamine synthase-like glycosyltransferase
MHKVCAVNLLIKEERYDRLERLEAIDFIDTYAAAFRLAVLREMGSFDQAFPQANNEDVELSYRLVGAGCRLMFNRQAVVHHRHPNTWRTYLCRKIKRGYWRMMVYRLYPGKAVRDSSTPQLLKAQIALMYLVLGLAGLAFVFPPLGCGAAATLVGLWLSAIPLIRRAVRQDKDLLLPALAFLSVRSLAFAIGMAGGMGGIFFFRPTLPGSREEVVRQDV